VRRSLVSLFNGGMSSLAPTFFFFSRANRAQPRYDRAYSLGRGMIFKGGRTMIRAAAAAAAAAASLWGQLVAVSLSRVGLAPLL
jgi:hypothetical protein